jgi:hypothetical protein
LPTSVVTRSPLTRFTPMSDGVNNMLAELVGNQTGSPMTAAGFLNDARMARLRCHVNPAHAQRVGASWHVHAVTRSPLTRFTPMSDGVNNMLAELVGNQTGSPMMILNDARMARLRCHVNPAHAQRVGASWHVHAFHLGPRFTPMSDGVNNMLAELVGNQTGSPMMIGNIR